MTNSTYVSLGLERVIVELEFLVNAIRDQDEQRIRRLLLAANRRRHRILDMGNRG